MCPSCFNFMHHACLSSSGVLPAAEIEYRGGCDEDILVGYDEFGDVSAGVLLGDEGGSHRCTTNA